MSTTYRGTKQPLRFGVETLEGYIIQTTEDSIEGEENEITDENGNVVCHVSGYGIKHNRSASVIPLSSVSTTPMPGDVFTIGEDFSFIIKSVKISRAAKDAEKWDISGAYYPEISLEEAGTETAGTGN